METGTRDGKSTVSIMSREFLVSFIFTDIISPSNNDEKNENEKVKGSSNISNITIMKQNKKRCEKGNKKTKRFREN